MTISSGGFNINPNSQLPIYQKETSAEENLRNQGQLGYGVVIQANTDLLSLAQLLDRNLFQGYRSDQPRPSLPNLGGLRTLPSDIKKTEVWEQEYLDLYEQLPVEIKNQLDTEFKKGPAEARSYELYLLNALLVIAARCCASLNRSEVWMKREEVIAHMQASLLFPEKAYESFLAFGDEMLNYAHEILEMYGPQDASYVSQMESLNSFEQLFAQLQSFNR